jgi:hypothetical protein
MRRTRYSLYSLATYLSLTGIGFLAAPQEVLGLSERAGGPGK